MMRRTPLKRTAWNRRPVVDQPLPTDEEHRVAKAVRPLARRSTLKARPKRHTAAEGRYLAAVAERGCELCRFLRLGATPCEVHHQRTGTGAGQRADHFHTTGLCPPHHRGDIGVHALGREQFAARYGISEVALVQRTRKALSHLLPTEENT